jgi:anti-sigma factor RsiW
VDHISPSEAIRYVGGELPPAEQAGLERHVAECPVCRACVEEQRELFALLGAWQVRPRTADQAAAVLDRLDAATEGGTRRLNVPAVLRVAAAVVLGVGLGYAGGRLVPVTDSTPRSDRAATASEPPAYELLSEPDVVGLWWTYDELEVQQGEGTS